jgi:hypothetical protein
MFIPSGDFIIVRRSQKQAYAHTRGEIVRGGMSEQVAKMKAPQYKVPGFDVWVMNKTEY